MREGIWRVVLVGLSIAFGLALAGRPSVAQECNSRSSPFLQTVCADEPLRSEYARSESVLKASLLKLSTRGRQQLNASHQAFLKYAAKSCARRWDGKTYAECLLAQFQGHLSKPEEVVVVLGKFRFLFVERYWEREDHSDFLDETQFYWFPPVMRVSSRLAIIDLPQNRTTDRFNQTMLEWPKHFIDEHLSPSMGPGNALADEDVVAASDELITMSLNSGGFYGGVHGIGGISNMHWSLVAGRPLRTTDVFKSKLDLRLAKLVAARASGNEPSEPFDTKLDWYNIFRASFSARGASFWFNPYELGCYVCTASIDFGWRELRPWLLPRLPFDPKKLNHRRSAQSH